MQRELAYRSGFVLQTPGYALAICYLYWRSALESPEVVLGAAYVFLTLGVLLSATLLRMRKKPVQLFVATTAVAGGLIEAAGLVLGVPALVVGGLAVVLIAAAGLAGREANCFALSEGWLLIPAYVVLASSVLWGEYAGQQLIAAKLLWIAVFLLFFSFTIRKLGQPLGRHRVLAASGSAS